MITRKALSFRSVPRMLIVVPGALLLLLVLTFGGTWLGYYTRMGVIDSMYDACSQIGAMHNAAKMFY